jgi:hypothetical protein
MMPRREPSLAYVYSNGSEQWSYGLHVVEWGPVALTTDGVGGLTVMYERAIVSRSDWYPYFQVYGPLYLHHLRRCSLTLLHRRTHMLLICGAFQPTCVRRAASRF